MENWRKSISISDEYEQDQEQKTWNDDNLPGGTHDPSEKWKPLEIARKRGYSISTSLEDPDIALRVTQDYTTTTLIEKESCAEDVIKVWDEVSKFIVQRMKEGCAVKIAGLGTFTYCEEIRKGSFTPTTPSSRKGVGVFRSRTKKVPLMILSEFIVRMYNLITPLEESLNTIPTCALNVSAIAKKTRIPRKVIDGVMTDVLQSFSRAIVLDKNVEFPFPSIGKLQISNRKVVFKFYSNFCTQLGFDAEDFEADGDNPDPFILPGTMTPLRRHIPTADFRSVFHLREIRSVHESDLLAPVRQIDGKFVATTGLDRDAPFVTEDNTKTMSRKFQTRDLYSSQIKQRLTISWVKGERNYLNPDSQPWPRHHFHVVESAIALK